ncbi:TSUP family transporter, partial [uncultured Salinisphaera sp.]|uniref:TSUP family transporter n=1 Tax=uncultured Salinisphaera sp. TaxID=359372 RepID=UPI0032B199EA
SNSLSDAPSPVAVASATSCHLWPRASVVHETTTTVLASGGYPGSYEKGKRITIPEDLESEDLIVFHAGTSVSGQGLVTSGGRVLAVTAIAGSALTVAAKVIASPKHIFDLLGSSLPKMCGFFSCYIIIKALAGLPMELARIVALMVHATKRLARPSGTPLIMAIFIALGVWPAWAQWLRMDGRGGLLVAGAIAGIMGPLVGGIGVLVAPFFLARDWRRENVIATMAVGQACGHAAKIVAFSLAGYSVLARWDLLVPMVLVSIAGTLIGRRLNDYVPERVFRIVVRVILIALALKLGFDGFRGWLA